MKERPLPRRDTASSTWLDLAAIGASGACLLHCLLLPVLLALLPAAGRLIHVPEGFHLAAFAAAIPASTVAMLLGYRWHCATHPMAMAAVGLALLGYGALGGPGLIVETGFSVLGSLILALGHVRNWRLRSRSSKT